MAGALLRRAGRSPRPTPTVPYRGAPAPARHAFGCPAAAPRRPGGRRDERESVAGPAPGEGLSRRRPTAPDSSNNANVTGPADIVSQLRVEPGSAPRLDRRDPGPRFGADDKAAGLVRLDELVERLGVLHDRLSAEATRAVPARPAGDGRVRKGRHDPPRPHRRQSAGLPDRLLPGADATPSSPTTTCGAFTPLCPARGEIAIFNRSHYEDVVAVRVRGLAPERDLASPLRAHPCVRADARRRGHERSQGLPPRLTRRAGQAPPGAARQPREALEVPRRRPRRPAALRRVPAAYEDAIRETSTDCAPWYVVPADHNWARNLAVSEILVEASSASTPGSRRPIPGSTASRSPRRRRRRQGAGGRGAQHRSS